MRLRLFTLVAVLGLAGLAVSQTDARGTSTATIKGKKVTIEYGRPALKGRAFADLTKQLPGDRMWRAGSGAVTILTTETPLMIGGKTVAAGKYSLYVHCPETGDYSLVLNSDLGQPLSKVWAAAPPSQANEPYPHFEYTKEIVNKEVVRAPLKKVVAQKVDVLTYDMQPSPNGILLRLVWGDQAWAIELRGAK
jgi:uncharacterized protein (DUF2141 family)